MLFRATLDTKSREFQYKLLNRCLVTNAFLFKVGLACLASTPDKESAQMEKKLP